MASNDNAVETQKHSVLNSSFPVLLPEDPALHMSENEFQDLLKQQIYKTDPDSKQEHASTNASDSVTVVQNEPVSTNLKRRASSSADNCRPQKAPFVTGLEKHAAHLRTSEQLAADNEALTENADVTNISAKNPLVDLFYDLKETTSAGELETLLENAWNEDPLLTLKIIFNARSIHLGKSSRITMYKAMGWLAETHPGTLLENLKWLVRPIIAKKTNSEAKKEPQDGAVNTLEEDFDMVNIDELDPIKAHDVRFGMSHGYWKDLLNLVVFSANDQLKVDSDPRLLLNQKPDAEEGSKRKRIWDQQAAKEARQRKKKEQNERVQNKMKNDPFHRALHIIVARLFAEQLKADKTLLDSGKTSDLKKLSLAAKWAPTFGEFHDKHTFILSSIAEILFPNPSMHCPDASNRELYLRHVRELYRIQYASPLRKALGVVERDIAANTFEKIKYERVPSVAMDRYSKLFLKKDTERFTSYIQDVTSGKATISGATLLPSTLVHQARRVLSSNVTLGGNQRMNFKNIQQATEAKVLADVVDSQWETLVKRVRDAGTLQSSIAVCDVSGSMLSPVFQDGSCPMDSAIGLSLLIAKVTGFPWSGIITFSQDPTYVSLDESGKGLREQVQFLQDCAWGMSTNFVAVFKDLILPMAIENKLKPEDMVKQIFVFSDMQFDQAENRSQRWTSSYERIKEEYAKAGYEMPRLIFWNLAARSSSKPTTMDDANTALVSGYSQGMLKAFLETGAFGDEEELEEEEVEVEGEDGLTEIKAVRKKIDPLTIVKKAVDHKAYMMLKVVD
ncbi:hypothetical protein yc1106_09706 [Curvularia clavata]|uniref:Uncharacterized protein n=1 Tax=Curvularia clavata TaxID=95742 RepID=A0A9Q9DX07_CURCL|nr:hypothetical protein yc1106_09706 [Curvularia clavata]